MSCGSITVPDALLLLGEVSSDSAKSVALWMNHRQGQKCVCRCRSHPSAGAIVLSGTQVGFRVVPIEEGIAYLQGTLLRGRCNPYPAEIGEDHFPAQEPWRSRQNLHGNAHRQQLPLVRRSPGIEERRAAQVAAMWRVSALELNSFKLCG